MPETSVPDHRSWEADKAETLTLSHRPLLSLFQIAGWGDDFANHAAPILADLGFPGIGQYRRVQTTESARSYHVAPNRTWVLRDNADKVPDHDGEQIALLDLSHARIAITVEGPDAAAMLQTCAPLDLSVEAFGAGHFAQTGIHEIPVLIERTGAEAFTLLVPCTWARSLWGTLTRAAIPFGHRASSTPP